MRRATTLQIDNGLVYEMSFAVTCDAIPVTRLPSGTQLAFVRGGRIYRVNSDGSGLVQMTDGPADSQPAWSRDGRRIAFVRKSGSKDQWGRELQDIYIMDADGSNLIRRTSGGLNADPTWSPDGTRIAFAALVLDSSTNIYEGGSNIYVMSADDDGKGSARVVKDMGWEVHPAWSPDGATIAFANDPGSDESASDIFVTTLDGSHVIRLTNATWGFGPLYYQPAWSPDGRTIAFSHSGYIGWIRAASEGSSSPTATARMAAMSRRAWGEHARQLA